MSTTSMTEERKGQIALALLELRMSEEGVRLNQNTLREIGSTVKELEEAGFKTDEKELETFSLELLTKLIGRAFGYQRVSLVVSE